MRTQRLSDLPSDVLILMDKDEEVRRVVLGHINATTWDLPACLTDVINNLSARVRHLKDTMENWEERH